MPHPPTGPKIFLDFSNFLELDQNCLNMGKKKPSEVKIHF